MKHSAKAHAKSPAKPPAPAKPATKSPAKSPAPAKFPAKAPTPAKSPAKAPASAKSSAKPPSRAKGPASTPSEHMPTPTAPPAVSLNAPPAVSSQPSPRRTRAKTARTGASTAGEKKSLEPAAGAVAGSVGRESAEVGRKRRGAAVGGGRGTDPADGGRPVADGGAAGQGTVTSPASDVRQLDRAQGTKRRKAGTPGAAV